MRNSAKQQHFRRAAGSVRMPPRRSISVAYVLCLIDPLLYHPRDSYIAQSWSARSNRVYCSVMQK